MVQLHNTLGNIDEVKAGMLNVTACMAKISRIEDCLLELKNENKRKSAWDVVERKEGTNK